jgi:hypothetical protein
VSHESDQPTPDDLNLHSAEIPAAFHSEYLDGPFVRCVDCDRELLDAGEVYSIVKTYVGKEPVFEMAICSACSVRLTESYSKQSREAFEKAVAEWRRNVAQPEKAAEPEQPSDQAPLGERIEHCVACGRSRAASRRYAIMGVFLGRQMVSPRYFPPGVPLMVCDDCNAAASEGISRHTRDTWDRFVEDHFDGPPGIELDSPKLEPVFV